MKILFILHSTIMGGATISFLNLVKGLDGKGYSIVVILPDDKNGLVGRLEEIRVKPFICPVVASVFASEVWEKKSTKKRIGSIIRLLKKKVSSFSQIYRIIKQEKPDLVHTNVGVVHEGFWASKVLGVPHVWHLREYQDLDFSWRIFPSESFFCYLLRKSGVISITKDIHHHFGLKEDSKHIVVYNGVLSQDRKELSLPKQDYYLCASRVSKEKGHEDVVRAFSLFHVTHPGFKLIILGFGDEGYVRFLKNLCVELSIEDAVVFQGYTDDVIPYMKNARGLIVASNSEGFGRMTAEAAFCGCLVIGRNTGGTKEILEEIGGFVFNTNEELQDRMNLLAGLDQKEYVAMVEHSQTKAMSLYSIEQNVDAIHSFYGNFLGVTS